MIVDKAQPFLYDPIHETLLQFEKLIIRQINRAGTSWNASVRNSCRHTEDQSQGFKERRFLRV